MTHHPELGWTPAEGDRVEIDKDNRWQLPAGRYRLRLRFPLTDGKRPEGWTLEGLASSAETPTHSAAIIGAHLAGNLRPLPRETLAREAEIVRLRLHAPLMGLRSGATVRQHDASDLELFRAASSPELGL